MKGEYRKGVFFVTYYLSKNKPRYLIQKRKLHWKGWEFPKAGVKVLESYKHAIKRELKEEAGLTALKIKKFKEKGKYKYSRKLKDRKDVVGQTYKLYAVETKKGKLTIDKREHYSEKWMDFNKAIKILTYPSQRKCLRIVDNWLKHDKV